MRVQQQPSYVLHTRAFSETSLLIDVFTREYGRHSLLAKGARRLKSQNRGLIRPFQSLLVSWSGKGQLPTLSGAEPNGPPIILRGDAWSCAYYMNELLMRLLHRHDAHEKLFDSYARGLSGLLYDDTREQVLRIFEKQLLRELGYALVLDCEADGRTPIEPGRTYHYVPEHGPVRVCREHENGLKIRGSSLLALSAEMLSEPQSRRECKRLIRVMLDRQLDGRALTSRRVMYRMRRRITR